MRNYICLVSLLFACSSHAVVSPPVAAPVRETVKQEIKPVKVKPTPVVPEEKLSEIQTACLTEGDSSLAAGKTWLKEKHPESCQNEATLTRLYNLASDVGERDAVKVVLANQLQCFSEVNELPKEGVEALDNVAQRLVASTELLSLKDNIDSFSCLDPEIQHTIIKVGFGCGFVLSLGSDATMKAAIDTYLEVADTAGFIRNGNQEDAAAALMQAAVCYKEVLDGIKNRIEGSDEPTKPEEKKPVRRTIDI